MATVCIIVAAGMGVRMGTTLPKALMPVGGRPLVAWSVATAVESGMVDRLVVVGPPGRLRELEVVIAGATVDLDLDVVAGGETRALSVAAGLAAAGDADRVLVHDAARPLASTELFRSVLSALDDTVDGAIAAAPLADTLKRGDGEVIAETLDRTGLWLAQTPQGFHLRALRGAYDALDPEQAAAATDCASIVEMAGGRVRLVPSGTSNLKVTIPTDVALAEHLLAAAGRLAV